MPNDASEIEKFFADIEDARIVIELSSAWYHICDLEESPDEPTANVIVT
jgi:hypothetical protein